MDPWSTKDNAYSTQTTTTSSFNDDRMNQSNQQFQQQQGPFSVQTYPNQPSTNQIPDPVGKLTKEDLKLLDECNREAFYYRSIPGMAISSSLVLFANSRKPLANFKLALVGSAFLGWFLGKISYRSQCREKIINSGLRSPFVDGVRKSAGLKPSELDDDATPIDFNPSQGRKKWQTELEDDLSEKNKPWQNLNQLPRMQDDDEYENDVKESKRSITYDELRARNRAGFQDHARFSRDYRTPPPSQFDPQAPLSEPKSF